MVISNETDKDTLKYIPRELQYAMYCLYDAASTTNWLFMDSRLRALGSLDLRLQKPTLTHTHTLSIYCHITSYMCVASASNACKHHTMAFRNMLIGSYRGNYAKRHLVYTLFILYATELALVLTIFYSVQKRRIVNIYWVRKCVYIPHKYEDNVEKTGVQVSFSPFRLELIAQ